MTAPVWITPPGDLGTVVENEFYQVQLSADNAVNYSYLSGVLPVGIRITNNGIVEGNPRNREFIQGIPLEVSQDVTSKFVVRATSTDGTVADRVFEMTVTGQDAPSIDATPLPDLGAYFDGDRVEVQLSATDPDPRDNLTWKLQSGNLPTGLSITTTGKIQGYIEPFIDQVGQPGFDQTSFDTTEWDFRTKSSDKNYEFVVEVTDGKQVDTKAYRIVGLSRNILTADIDTVTVDNDSTSVTATNTIESILDASQTSLRNPALITESTGLGRVSHENNYNFQFLAKDFDGDRIEFVLHSGSLPTGLTLDQNSGWLHGTIPTFNSAETTFTFALKVRKVDRPEFVSLPTTFTMTIVGDASSVVTWPNSNLTIKTGDISELDVIATISDDRPVQYEIKTNSTEIQAGNFVVGETYTIITPGITDFVAIGSKDNKAGTEFTATGAGSGDGIASLGKNKLPQGLKLNNSGLIVGRVSFEHFMLDSGSTTFDIEDLYSAETTFEKVYTFVVRVFSADGIVDTYKKFSIKLAKDTSYPYESLYAKALPSVDQRAIYNQLIQNADDIPQQDVYRPSDFSFGVQRDIRALIISGLQPKTLANYTTALTKNFYNNTLRFGELKTARALNSDGTVKYEVVYAELVDKKQGVDPLTKVSASPVLRQDVRSDLENWANPFQVSETHPDVSHSHYSVDQVNDYYVYPNSIENMRERIKTQIGFQVLERKVLPGWMKDKQEDDTVLGWTLAAPIVYCKPGTSAKIKYRLEKRTESDLKKISFEVDRLILDMNLSKYFDKFTNKFTLSQETVWDSTSIPTTFDAGGTRFYGYVDVFATQDDGDIFLKFPQVGPFDRLPYTER